MSARNVVMVVIWLSGCAIATVLLTPYHIPLLRLFAIVIALAVAATACGEVGRRRS